eukprot:6492332-Amphidinium_carterae.1
MTYSGSDVSVTEDLIAVSPAKPAQKRKKGTDQSGTVTKDDMKRYMDQLSESLGARLDRNFASLASDVREVRRVAEDASHQTGELAQELATLKEDLDARIEAKVRELTPPRAMLPQAQASSSGSSSTSRVNPQRLVINGWSTPQHRSTLIAEVNTILSRASEKEDIKRILQGVTISAPKVRGKTVLVDLLPPHRASEIKSELLDAFLANNLKVKTDRTMEERQRSSTLVAAARAMDVYLTEKGRERSEICWSDGIVWVDDIKAGQYVRASAAWTWNIEDLAAVLTQEELNKLKALRLGGMPRG